MLNSEESVNTTVEAQETWKEVLVFKMFDSLYSLPVDAILEVTESLLTITAVPNSTNYLLGSTTIRGEVIPVIDLHTFFYNTDSPHKEDSEEFNNVNYVLIEYNGQKFIVRVGTVVRNVIRINQKELDSITDLYSSAHLFFLSSFLYDSQVVFCINLDAVMTKINEDFEEKYEEFLSQNTSITPITQLSDERLKDLNISLEASAIFSSTVTPSEPVRTRTAPQKHLKETYLYVKCGSFEILIPNTYLREIYNLNEITTPPRDVESFIGSFNYRGEVISLFNLYNVLYNAELDTSIISNVNSEEDADTQILILEYEDQFLSLVVDEIVEIPPLEDSIFQEKLSFKSEFTSDYFFTSAMVTESNEIKYILDVNFLFNLLLSEEQTTEFTDTIILFNNSKIEREDTTAYEKRDGILFEIDNQLYFLNSSNIQQIIDREFFFLKEFESKVLIGTAIYEKLSPVININGMLGKETSSVENLNQNERLAGIILKSNTDFDTVIIADNIIGRFSTDSFETYQSRSQIFSKGVNPLISGLFTFTNQFGLNLNPIEIENHTSSFFEKEFGWRDVETNFPNLVSEEEKELLKEKKSQREQVQSLLFSDEKMGTYISYLILELEDYRLSIECDLIEHIHSSSKVESQALETREEYLLGFASVDEDSIPIIDLNYLLYGDKMSTEVLVTCEHLLLVKIDETKLFLPVNKALSVNQIIKEDMEVLEDVEIFPDNTDVCNKTFEIESISGEIFAVKTEYLLDKLSKLNVQDLIQTEIKSKNNSTEKNNKEV